MLRYWGMLYKRLLVVLYRSNFAAWELPQTCGRLSRCGWVFVIQKSGLKLLHREVNDATAALGYELEDKRFRPHLPVAVLESEQKPRPVARELSPCHGCTREFYRTR